MAERSAAPGRHRLAAACALLLGLGLLQGCALAVVAAAGAAGGIAATELEENDGKFDPLERTRAGQALSDAIN
ncbi:MAG: hypothetical protein AAF074_04150 [Pseudomonadota bacterium]